VADAADSASLSRGSAVEQQTAAFEPRSRAPLFIPQIQTSCIYVYRALVRSPYAMLVRPIQKPRGRPESLNCRNVIRDDEDDDDGDDDADDDRRRMRTDVEGRERRREREVNMDEGDGRQACGDEAAVSSGLGRVQCKIRPLILRRFANQPRHCSPVVKAREFLGRLIVP
jgi:hypothetical protein